MCARTQSDPMYTRPRATVFHPMLRLAIGVRQRGLEVLGNSLHQTASPRLEHLMLDPWQLEQGQLALAFPQVQPSGGSCKGGGSRVA